MQPFWRHQQFQSYALPLPKNRRPLPRILQNRRTPTQYFSLPPHLLSSPLQRSIPHYFPTSTISPLQRSIPHYLPISFNAVFLTTSPPPPSPPNAVFLTNSPPPLPPAKFSQRSFPAATGKKLVPEVGDNSGKERMLNPLPGNGYWGLRRLYVSCSTVCSTVNIPDIRVSIPAFSAFKTIRVTTHSSLKGWTTDYYNAVWTNIDHKFGFR
jgi:hypothetical protein